MIIFPAIDILNGNAVRLYKGDYNAATVYDADCVSVARGFKSQGASHIHIVDLDGAKRGVAVNADVVKRIIAATDAFAEVGGGIRTETQIAEYLEAGAGRIILGTAAVRERAFVVGMAKKYGDKIAVGVDAADGKVAVSGWLEVTDTNAVDFCRRLAADGVRHVIYTDISRDGTLGGANIEVYSELTRIDGLKVTASGGISSLSELDALKKIGVYAAILGKALYENRLSLSEAVKAAEDEHAC